MYVYIAASGTIALISGFLNIIVVNRLYRIYVLNVKGAFRVDYGLQFMGVEDGL